MRGIIAQIIIVLGVCVCYASVADSCPDEPMNVKNDTIVINSDSAVIINTARLLKVRCLDSVGAEIKNKTGYLIIGDNNIGRKSRNGFIIIDSRGKLPGWLKPTSCDGDSLSGQTFTKRMWMDDNTYHRYDVYANKGVVITYHNVPEGCRALADSILDDIKIGRK